MNRFNISAHNVFPPGALPSGKKDDLTDDLTSNEISDFSNAFRRLGGSPAAVYNTVQTALRVMKAIDLWSERARQRQRRRRSVKQSPTERKIHF